MKPTRKTKREAKQSNDLRWRRTIFNDLDIKENCIVQPAMCYKISYIFFYMVSSFYEEDLDVVITGLAIHISLTMY